MCLCKQIWIFTGRFGVVIIFFTLDEDSENRSDVSYPDNKVHGANMGPTWALSAPDGPNVVPMNFAIRVIEHLSNIVSTVHTHK